MVYLPNLPKSGSLRRVQGIGFWYPLTPTRTPFTHVPISVEQWRTVEALVSTVISPGTQRLLAERGYRMLLQRDGRNQQPALLMDVRHPAGLVKRA